MSDIKWHDFPEEKPNYGDLILWLHWQAINKPPDVIIFDRETEWIDGDRWAKINDEPKRKPLPNGVLPMTKEELKYFQSTFKYPEIDKIIFQENVLVIKYKIYDDYAIQFVDEILYLNTLFDLNMETKSE